MLAIAAAIFVVVAALLVYSVVKFRKPDTRCRRREGIGLFSGIPYVRRDQDERHRSDESGTLRAVAARHEECSPPRLPREARSDCLDDLSIHAERPGWKLFRDGCPGGEMPQAVGARADRVIQRVRAIDGDVLLFSSAHFLRVFAARWLGLESRAGKYFVLGTASLSEMGYEHERSEPVIRLWDETHHECCIARQHAREKETA